jgi:hypothetical protein
MLLKHICTSQPAALWHGLCVTYAEVWLIEQIPCCYKWNLWHDSYHMFGISDTIFFIWVPWKRIHTLWWERYLVVYILHFGDYCGTVCWNCRRCLEGPEICTVLLLVVLHKLHWFFHKHYIGYELKGIMCYHATHYNGISSLLIKAICNLSFSAEIFCLNLIYHGCVMYKGFSVRIISWWDSQSTHPSFTVVS